MVSVVAMVLLLPIQQEKLVLDGQSLRAIIRAHDLSYGAFSQEVGEVTLPAPTIQFLEGFNIEVIQEGNHYTVRYFPRDTRVRGGAYVVVLKLKGGELSPEEFRIEP